MVITQHSKLFIGQHSKKISKAATQEVQLSWQFTVRFCKFYIFMSTS